jgi:hypothetical protein
MIRIATGRPRTPRLFGVHGEQEHPDGDAEVGGQEKIEEDPRQGDLPSLL